MVKSYKGYIVTSVTKRETDKARLYVLPDFNNVTIVTM